MKSIPIELKTLENDFTKYKEIHEYNNLNKLFIPQIKYKIYSKGFLFNLRDYEEEVYGRKKGKEIKKIPKKGKNIYTYYFNENNQIIMVDNFWDNQKTGDRTFCIYENNTIKTIHYSSTDILSNVTLATKLNNRTDKVYSYGSGGIKTREYIYNGNLLEKIVEWTKEHDPKPIEYNEFSKTLEKMFGKKTDLQREPKIANNEYLFEFKNEDLEKIIRIYDDKSREIIYNKRYTYDVCKAGIL